MALRKTCNSTLLRIRHNLSQDTQRHSRHITEGRSLVPMEAQVMQDLEVSLVCQGEWENRED